MPTRTDALKLGLRGRHVGDHVIPVQIAEIAARIRDLVRRIAAFEVAHEAVEHRRRHRHIAERGEPVADRADVMVDAENLLDDHHAALRRALRIGAIGAELMLVAGGECELLAQGKPPILLSGQKARCCPPFISIEPAHELEALPLRASPKRSDARLKWQKSFKRGRPGFDRRSWRHKARYRRRRLCSLRCHRRR